MNTDDCVKTQVEVAIDPATAFDIFTGQIGQWWKRGPRNFYDSKRAVAMRFEPGIGGRYLEVYDDTKGDVLEIGRITVWEPGKRLVWRMSLDDTEVVVRFDANSTGTLVTLEQHFVPSGTTSNLYTGWRNILGWFKEWGDLPAGPARWSDGIHPLRDSLELAAEGVANSLGCKLDSAWTAALKNADPLPALTIPDRELLVSLLAKLDVSPDDAAEVDLSMPSQDIHPEVWWLLVRSSAVFTSALAHRDIASSASSESQGHPDLDWSIFSGSIASQALQLFPVHLILANIEKIRQCHAALSIPEDISWQTLSFLGRAMRSFRQHHGQVGIRLTRWDWLRFLGRLYEVERLEVTPFRIRTAPKGAGPLFWYDDDAANSFGVGWRKGDPALGVHVPATGRLSPESIDASLSRMQRDLRSPYSGECLRVAICTSWLLDEHLAQYLPADSNIISFQRRFRLVSGARDDDGSVVRFVYGCEMPKEIEMLPQNTALQRAVVRHLQKGLHWKLRTGWLDLESFACDATTNCADA